MTFEVEVGGVLRCETEGCAGGFLADTGVVGVDLGDGFVDTDAVVVPDLGDGFVEFSIGVLVNMGDDG